MNLIYDFKNKTIDCSEDITMTPQEIYMQHCSDRRLNQINRQYDIAMMGITQKHYIFINGWTPTNRLVKKIRSGCIEISDNNIVEKRYIALYSLSDDHKGENRMHYNGELFEILNEKEGYIDFVQSHDEFNTFKMIGVDISDVISELRIIGDFLSQDYIDSIFTKENYPEYWL